jgi:hypothetical protein
MAWHVMRVCDVFDVKTVQLALPVQLLLLVAHKGRPLQPARPLAVGLGGKMLCWGVWGPKFLS